MVKVKTEVWESLLSQLETTPEMRTGDIFEQISNDNPEFLQGLSNIFAGYIRFNIQHGVEISQEQVELMGKVALMFGAYGYKLVQNQLEVNALEEEEPVQS